LKNLNSFLLLGLLAIVGCGSGGGGNTQKTTPVITWATPASVPVGTALSSTQLNATANVQGTFVYSPVAGTIESTAGTVMLSTTFTPVDTTDYTTATASVSLTVSPAAPAITWATPAPVAVGTALSSTQLDATANVPGTFVYTPAAGTIESTAGNVTLSVTFTPTDTTNYSTAMASVTLEVAATSTGATVDFGATNQIIRGFGGSEAWAGAMPNGQISALFGTSGTEVGLSILRLRIAPATWDSTTKTADTTQWTTELNNGLAAQTLGATIFASPWSAPTSMKTNGSVNEGSLSTSSYADYAAYLEAYVKYASSLGVNLYAISMQNEPDWNPCPASDNGTGTGAGCYESCLWTAAQMDTWVAQNSSVLTTKLMMPESFGFYSAMSDPALDDVNAVNHIAIIGGHIYGGPIYYYNNAVNKGKDVWMTEHYLNTASGSTPAIGDAIALAEEVHNSMTVGQYNAYVWWGSSDATSASVPLIDTNNNTNYFGYALAQYSRFVRPGYYRVNATATPSSGIYLSAYTGGGHAVIVAINSNSSAEAVPITIQNQSVSSLTPYQTTANGGLAMLSPVSVTSNAATVILPAESITTLVQ
jgi:glucuronoarabinoxylan endo-1,4-beta-xylanase